jgi:hypothetical protein
MSKSSVYRAYVDMCRSEGRQTLFTRAVVGKMVKRAFPDLRTKRSGPRGRVTQYYLGLRRFVMASDPRPVPDVDRSDDTITMPQVKEEDGLDVLDRDVGSSGSGEWSVADNAYADPQQPHIAGNGDWTHLLKDLERQWDSTVTSVAITTPDGCTSAVATTNANSEAAGDDEELDRLLAWADTVVAQDEDALRLLVPDVRPVHYPSW